MGIRHHILNDVIQNSLRWPRPLSAHFYSLVIRTEQSTMSLILLWRVSVFVSVSVLVSVSVFVSVSVLVSVSVFVLVIQSVSVTNFKFHLQSCGSYWRHCGNPCLRNDSGSTLMGHCALDEDPAFSAAMQDAYPPSGPMKFVYIFALKCRLILAR
jgi:hypothetical protein